MLDMQISHLDEVGYKHLTSGSVPLKRVHLKNCNILAFSFYIILEYVSVSAASLLARSRIANINPRGILLPASILITCSILYNTIIISRNNGLLFCCLTKHNNETE